VLARTARSNRSKKQLLRLKLARSRPAAASEAAPVAIRQIPLASIDWSSAVRRPNREHIERLGGAVNLPAVVVWEYERDKFRGVDGYHRWLLAKLRGHSSTKAMVRHYPSGDLGERQFDLDAVRMNIEHGLPLTREERDRAIIRLWTRWGRISARPDGVTLEELGQAFGLTKGRIHQIIYACRAQPTPGTTAERRVTREPANVPVTRDGRATAEPEGHRCRAQVTSGFSPFGRFSAAAKRLTTVLGDRRFLAQLLDERPDVRQTLCQLRDLLEGIICEELRTSAYPRSSAPTVRR